MNTVGVFIHSHNISKQLPYVFATGAHAPPPDWYLGHFQWSCSDDTFPNRICGYFTFWLCTCAQLRRDITDSTFWRLDAVHVLNVDVHSEINTWNKQLQTHCCTISINLAVTWLFCIFNKSQKIGQIEKKKIKSKVKKKWCYVLPPNWLKWYIQ